MSAVPQPIQSVPNQLTFNTAGEAIAAAAYVEQVLAAEQQWITNRLSWLFVSQSFCITAYMILVTSTGVRPGTEPQLNILRIGLPIFSIICCVAVGIAIIAAASVARQLANERARLSRYLNERCGTTIPLIGVDGDLRTDKIRWTQWGGSLPHWLPWVVAALWVVLLVRANFL